MAQQWKGMNTEPENNYAEWKEPDNNNTGYMTPFI